MLLLVFFVTTAVATPLLGTEQCVRGPPYWCQNVKTASLCGAVSHCQQNVWNKPQMKSVPCDLCKEVLIVVDQLLKDNATEAEILSYVEKACSLIPDEGLADECKELVDSYYPIIIGIIKGELEDPSIACGALGLCSSLQAALAKAQAELLSNEIPKVDLSQRVAPFLLNVPQLLYPDEANGKETKVDLSHNASPFLLNVPQLLYPEEPKRETPKKDSGNVCDDCVKFLAVAQEQAKTNATFVISLIEQTERQCDSLGAGIADVCKQYVRTHGALVTPQLMSMEQQPINICARAGFCDDVVKAVPMQTLLPAKVLNSVPAVKMVPATKVEKTAAAKPAQKLVRARDSPQCAICEFVMKEVEDMLQDKHTEEEVVQTVEKVCAVLPKTLSAQCKDLIETYGAAIIDLLVQEADPKTVCAVLGLCKEADRLFIPAMDQEHFKAGGFCDVCKMAVRYVDGILEQNATEEEIEDAVRKVCNFLPESYRSECDQLVEQYEPMLVQLLLQMLDPDFVCMKVGACPEGLKRLLGMEKCSWGPAYWCKNMQTATRCNAVAHCKRHIWS